MRTANRYAHKFEAPLREPTPRRQTPPWTEAIFEDASQFDLRPRRDLSGRRRAREWGRGLLRATTVIIGDAIVSGFALWLTLSLVSRAPAEGMAFFPRLLILLVFAQAAAGTYKAGRAHVGVGRILKGVIAALVARASVDAMYAVHTFGLREYAGLGALLAGAICAWRIVVAQCVRWAYAKGVGQERALIVADRDRAFEVLERFQSADQPRIRLMGHIAPQDSIDPTSLGGIDDLGRFIEELDISCVIVSGDLPKKSFEEIVRTCFLHGTAVSLVPATLADIPCRVSSRDVLGWPLIELEAPRIHLAQVVAKRSMDVVLSLILLVVLAPLFGLITLTILLESRGPIVFRQSRPGLGGKRFYMFKFRTMRPDAEKILQADPELFRRFLENDCKLPDQEDPRISRLGRFLRRSSLDELPQLWNVVRGEMSLIGPRPVVGPELEHYGDLAAMVLGVRPGMTGHWQVKGRSSVMFPERAHLDAYYVTRWSLALDLKILLLTLPAVLRRSGAF